MTHKELSEFSYLRSEIRLNKARLADAAAAGDTELAAMLERKIQGDVEKQKQVQAYIDALPNSLMRQIFTLKFCEGLTIDRVASVTGKSATSIKRRLSRHFQAQREENCPN